MRSLEDIYGGGLVLPGRGAGGRAAQPAPGDEPLDETGPMPGLGRSPTFPLPQWRARDPYRTVYFDAGGGRPLVFVHGLGGNATNWEFIAAPLADRYRVAGLDLAGCGWSRKPDVRYSVGLLRDHLLDFLERRAIRRATLVGHSLGGAVCVAAALARPDLVESLVLVCAACLVPLPAWMRVGSRALLDRRVLYSLLTLGTEFILSNVFVDREENNRYVRWFRRSSLRDEPGYPNLRDFARVGTHLCRSAVETDFSGDFKSLRVPVLAIVGNHDRLTDIPALLRHLDAVPRVRTVVIQRSGHMPMIERPEETLVHIERFLTDPPL